MSPEAARPIAYDLCCGLEAQMFQAYSISCLVNGKRYIGITSRSLRQRWNEHLYDARRRSPKMAISRAIAKHGADQFRMEPLCSARSWEDICAAEALLIVQYGTRSKRTGYNVSDGGEGPIGVRRSAESVERSAAKHRGKPCHPNTREAAIRAHRGVPKAQAHRDKIAAGRRGKAHSPEAKAKIAAYWAERRARGEFKTDRPYAHGAK